MAEADENVGSRVVKALKWAAGVVAAIGVLLTAAAFAGDTRYVQMADMTKAVQEVKKSTTDALEQAHTEMKFSVDQARKMDLEDKIFEITQIPEGKRTGVQRALLDRHLRQVNELNNRWVTPPPGNRQP